VFLEVYDFVDPLNMGRRFAMAAAVNHATKESGKWTYKEAEVSGLWRQNQHLH